MPKKHILTLDGILRGRIIHIDTYAENVILIQKKSVVMIHQEKKLGCSTGNVGTCAVCGYNYTNANHCTIRYGECAGCHKKIL